MPSEDFFEFIKVAMDDPVLAAKVAEIGYKDVEGLIALAKDLGFDVSPADFKEVGEIVMEAGLKSGYDKALDLGEIWTSARPPKA